VKSPPCRYGAVLLAAAAMLATFPVAGQAYPAKPVRIIVPFAAGGGSDLAARQVAAKLATDLGQQFVIDNRGGGGGLVGMELTATAGRDGYTTLFTSGSYAATLALRKLAFDPLKTISPLIEVASAPYVIAMYPGLPAKNLGELLALARAKPGTLAYASPGAGSLGHLATALLLTQARAPMTHVPYKGAGAALGDLLAGRCAILITTAVSLMPHFQSGRLRAVAFTGTARLPEMPDVPIASDTVPGYVVYTWYGMLLPTGTPRAVVDRLNTAVNRVLAADEMRRNFDAQGMTATGGAPERLGERIREDYARWTRVVQENQIRVE